MTLRLTGRETCCADVGQPNFNMTFVAKRVKLLAGLGCRRETSVVCSIVADQPPLEAEFDNCSETIGNHVSGPFCRTL